jgi:hypothetical protein
MPGDGVRQNRKTAAIPAIKTPTAPIKETSAKKMIKKSINANTVSSQGAV